MSAKRLLYYAPVPLYRDERGLLLEDQASNGLRLWAENFDLVTAMYPIEDGPAPKSWVPIRDVVPNLDRITLEPLPTAYRPDQFLKVYRETRDRIRAHIPQADYMTFAIGGLTGDWGAVSCLQAHKMGRPYAVWTDRVESEVIRRTASSGPLRKRIKARLEHRPMAWLERYVIRRSKLGLFHGKETYDAYAPYCENPVVVHDIHLGRAEHIPDDELAAKIAGAANGPLRIGYVGRAEPMKGPQDWIAVLEGLAAKGVAFEAFWMGEGSQMTEMERLIADKGLAEQVQLLGFMTDRAAVLNKYREADVFLFCHKTPESPRCLIEALISGTPIVGYHGAFAEDLISEHGGGYLAPLNDVNALTEKLVELSSDRQALAGLIDAAKRDGDPYDDEHVFKHRSDIIKEHL